MTPGPLLGSGRPSRRRAGPHPARRLSAARWVLLPALPAVLTCDWIAGLGNDPPQASASIPDQIVDVDSAVVLDLADHFADPDGDSLAYTALSDSPANALAEVSGSRLAVTGVAAGRTAVSVTARDPDNLSVEQSFGVTVPNRSPLVADTIADGEVHVDDTLVIDVSAYFADPDGDDLEYSAASSDPARATVAVSEGTLTVVGMAVGGTTVTVTARDPGGLTAGQDFGVTVPNRAPRPVGAIGDRVLQVDSMLALEVASYFADPDRDSLAYAAASSDSSRATVVVSGSELTLTGRAKGSIAVTVTARDPGDLAAEQVFAVTVPNRTPVAVDTIPDRELHVGDEIGIRVAAYFSDPDGDDLEYAATSSDTTRAVVAVSGDTVTVTGAAVGAAAVTVTARDPEGLWAGQVFGVKLPNRAPEPLGTIPDWDVYVGDTVTVDVAAYFVEPDGQVLEYVAASSSAATAAVTVSGSMVAVAGTAVGGVVVTVTARDPGGLQAGQNFAVTVPNRAPGTVGRIADREVEVDSAVVVDVAAYFVEPDGQVLAYAAASSDPARAAVALSGSALSVTGVAKGRATVTVTARDPDGLAAEQDFGVTVPNRAPEPRGTIPSRDVYVGDTARVDAAAYFAEPDGERLAYAAASSSAAMAAVAVSGGTVTVTGVAVGSATVTVTAEDPGGLQARQGFAVTIPNRAPVAVGEIEALEVEVDGAARVDVAARFTEPDGEELEFAASSSDTTRAVVAVSGGTLTVRGAAKGIATVTVTARDPGGLTAEQRFEVTVPNRAPVAVAPIADRVIPAGVSETVGLSAHFTDPDGDALQYSATSADNTRATVSASGGVLTVTGEAGGSATVTVSARDSAGLSASQRFEVTVPNQAPEAVGTIGDRAVLLDNSISPDVARYFRDPDDDDLTHTATSSDTATASVSVSGTTVTVTGEAVGTATITVLATDSGGLSATQPFAVAVETLPPSDLVVESMSATPALVGPNESIILDAVIRNRGDGRASATAFLRYHRSTDTTISMSDTQIGTDSAPRLDPSESSPEDLSVTAPSEPGIYYYGACVDAVDNESDTDNNCSRAVEVEVAEPNNPPRAVDTIPDRTVVVEGEASVDVAPYFTDPDGDELFYAAESSDTEVASVGVSGSTVGVTGEAEGEATITVTATDPGDLRATQQFDVTVEAAPPSDLVTESPEADPDELGPQETFTLSVQVRNRGGGGASSATTLRYHRSADDAIDAGDTEIDTAAVPRLDASERDGHSLAVTSPSSEGTYYYGACVDPVDNESDTDNNCSAAVAVVVVRTNRPPRPVGEIPDATVEVDEEWSVDVAPYFTDPDGDDLTYAASSSSTTVATVTVSGSDVQVSGHEEGDATITVTATDPGGLSATQSFEVEVEPASNRPPFVADSLPDIGNATAGETRRANLLDVFEDPDGDDLTWTTESSDTAAVRSLVTDDTISVVAVAAGSATVTVTATDEGGLSATDTFEVTVLAARFDVDLWITRDVSDTQLEYIDEARDRWEAILKDTELADITFTTSVRCLGLQVASIGTVDDHAVLVHVDSIDGPGRILAYAGYCYTRTADGTPIISATVFDEDDIEKLIDEGNLEEVAMHEIAHGLGFTDDYWEEHDLLETGDDPHFAGELAVEAFDDAGGGDYDDNKVPISSPDHSHWRPSVFGREGMAPALVLGQTHPFSAITLQAMADVGYEVDESLADDYQLPGSLPPPDTDPADPGRVFDLSGDVVRGPVIVVDADGRIVRVVPSPDGVVPPPFRHREVRIGRRGGDAPGKWVRSAQSVPSRR